MLTNSQLKELIKIGFCLHASPKTAGIVLGADNFMRVCVDESRPDPNALIYTPTRERIGKDIAMLKAMLSSTKSIDLVTIARSNRDGFVPRSMQPVIEKETLQLVTDYNRNRQKVTQIVYDDDLMVHTKTDTQMWRDRDPEI